jgi:dihydropteroate synthase
MRLVTRHAALDLSHLPVVMGVLNVTPDSFSDGGAYLSPDAATVRASQMVAEGAGIIDVGPESTRPGSSWVDADAQIQRAIPVIDRIRREHPAAVISVDTTLATVADAALRAGADMINDVTALRGDPGMAALVADADVPVVLMHMQGTPETMQKNPTYGDVVEDVRGFLAERIAFARSAGIKAERVVIDPGIGFGKTSEHNCELIRRLNEFVSLGPPVMLGASRKSTVQRFVGADPAAVLAGSLMCALAAVSVGAKIIRAHDVAETVSLITAASALSPRPLPP